MTGLDGTITISTSEYRPCIVKNRKALFHRWEEKASLLEGRKAVSVLNVDIPSGYIKTTIAIIEYEDGVVTECYPYELRFCDNKFSEYIFSEKEGQAYDK